MAKRRSERSRERRRLAPARSRPRGAPCAHGAMGTAQKRRFERTSDSTDSTLYAKCTVQDLGAERSPDGAPDLTGTQIASTINSSFRQTHWCCWMLFLPWRPTNPPGKSSRLGSKISRTVALDALFGLSPAWFLQKRRVVLQGTTGAEVGNTPGSWRAGTLLRSGTPLY